MDGLRLYALNQCGLVVLRVHRQRIIVPRLNIGELGLVLGLNHAALEPRGLPKVFLLLV